MIESKNILDNIIQVNSSSGGFYNPSKSHRMGTFYLEFNEANPKSISFKYDGHINISLSKSIVGAKVRHYSSRNSVIIDFPPNCKFENDLIFSFTGNLKFVKSLKIHNWKGKVLSPKFIQYDQTNLYVNYSKTNFEDDTILIEPDELDTEAPTIPAKKRNYTNLNKIINEDLPESYIDYSEKLEMHQFCQTCSYWKNKYCELWQAPIQNKGWCKSWQKKGIK